jgi:hypothetical protein
MHKVAGTDWPPDAVVHHNTSVSLGSIFEACRIVLQIKKVEEELPPFSGGRSFELADLNATLARLLEQTIVPDPMLWTAHVLIVPDILVTYRSHYCRPLGLMFDTDATQDRPTRQGCAIAYRRVQSEPRLYLRTVAHELGHVFNLGHPGEGNEPFSPDAVNTLMVPTEYLRPPHRIPDTLKFCFAAIQRNWLAQVPDVYIRPGACGYGARPENWPTAFLPIS